MTTAERLARYRAGKSEEYNTFVESKFIKPTARKRSHSNVRNVITEKILETVKRLGIEQIIPALPFLGWTICLKFLLWLILFGLFVELEFGMIFLLLSTFYIIYANTSTGERLKDEPSAYSVFNPNCERLQGSLTAEQFEGELRYGSGSVR